MTERITIDVETDSESHFFAGLRGDVVREGGLFVATHRDLRVGQKVMVEIAVDATRVLAIGVVRWRTPGGGDLPCGAGVAFEDLSEGDRRVIETFCARRPPFYFDAGERISVA